MIAQAGENIGGYVGHFVVREPPREARHGQRLGARRASADAPERQEVWRIVPVGEFAVHRIGTLLHQPLRLIAQLPTFQEKRINAGAQVN
jgi:hypothetical protein